MDIKITRKPWVNHIITAGGILVGIFIILGYFNTVRLFTDWMNNIAGPRCDTCITLNHNKTKRVVRSGVDMTLELPAATYPTENLLIISEPSEIVEIYDTQAKQRGNWAKTLHFVAPGTAEIIVPSATPAVSDFQMTLTIQ